MENIGVSLNPVQPEISPIAPPKSSRNIILGLAVFISGIITGLLLSVFLAGFFPQVPTPANFAECVKTPGSTLQTSFPSTCITKGGVSFTEVLSDEDKRKISLPSTFDECVAAPQSTVQYTYPGTCVTKDGVSFIQPTPTVPPTELSCGGITNKKCPAGYLCETTAMYPDAMGTCTLEIIPLTYQCPANGWVDCEPPLVGTRKAACSPEAMDWYQANCPNFQGGAL